MRRHRPLPPLAGRSHTAARITLVVAALGVASGCTDRITAPSEGSAGERLSAAVASAAAASATPAEVRALAAQKNVVPLVRPKPVRPALAALGQALAFDKELSGNRDISCMTCHLPSFATGDGRSLSVGQGATGLGPERVHPQGVFIPRNAPPLFGLAAMNTLFWDGRVSVDAKGRFRTPAGDLLTGNMVRLMEFGASSALGLFPVTNRAEMRGAPGSNELANLRDDDFQGIWRALMARLGKIPEYRSMFEAAYPGTQFKDMTFAHASNAMAGFFAQDFFFNDTPWDRFLAGDDRALTPRQLEGAKTFLSIRCVQCHNGATFSDGKFHNVAVAQLGPGEGDGPGGTDDFGRFRVSGLAADRYAFRTTPLRNVELTAPFGHDGAIVDLRDFIAHYSESDQKLLQYDPAQLEPLLRNTVVDNKAAVIAQRDTIIVGVVLPDDVIDNLRTYMQALTDGAARNLASTVPASVPSGLPVDR